MASTSSKSPVSPAFPTFLDTDPYPTTREGRPMSSASIATSATSDFGGDDARSTRNRDSTVPSVTGPVGESGLPPSRPTSIGPDDVKRKSLQPPASRKGPSRPTTGANRTHVPSLVAQAIFRPMSSSKLQAQRNQVPTEVGEDTSAGASQEDRTSHRRRYSNASVNTLKELQAMRKDDPAPPMPVSRAGTQVTSDGEHATESINSVTPLRGRQNGTRNVDAGAHAASKSRIPEQRSHSPRGWTTLGVGSRSSNLDQERRPSPGFHEKLQSRPSSSHHADKNVINPPSRPTKNVGRNYEYFAGNVLFCLSGRCMNTKAVPLNLLTLVLTVLPAALFGAFSAPWLWKHVTPALPIIFAYIFFITLSSFIHAAVTDPGILPRNIHPHPPNPDEDRDPLTVGPSTTEWVMVKSFPAASQRSPHPNRANDNSGENGTDSPGPTTAMEVPTKYCKTCDIWRPPRTHHCRVCDACIETQDHHCVWLNNCVGRRNYRYFFSYVAFGSLLALLLLIFSLVHVAYYAKLHHISFMAAFTGRTPERIAFAMFIYAVLALPYPGSLFIYHLFLIGRGETTREYLNSHKFQKKDRHRPFTQSSSLRNWVSVLVRPRPPTYMRFRHAYQPGDVRLGYSAPKAQRKEELKGRYAVQGNGASEMTESGKRERDVEMKQFAPSGPEGGNGRKASTGTGGGLSGPLNRTPR